MYPMHGGFMGRFKGVGPCAYVPGLYTEAEVDDLINIDGYIPVADADEFDKIRTGAVETMGGCSIWAGSYTTGRDKKYIQIFDIDFALFGPFTPIGVGQAVNNFEGTYDGNELYISNVIIPSFAFSALFGNCTGSTIVNLTCVNFDIKGNICAPLVAQHFGAGTCIVDNCHSVNCTNTSSTSLQALYGGLIAQNHNTAIVTVTNCSVTNFSINTAIGSSVLSNSLTAVGGFIGDNRVGNTIQNCTVNGFTTNQKYIRTGAFCGSNGFNLVEGGIIDFCQAINIGALTAHSFSGGFCGENAGTITNCKTDCVSITTDNREAGGFVGWVSPVAGQITPILIENCFTIANATSLTQFGAGGFCGRMNGAATIRNCYSRGNAVGATQVGGFIGRIGTGTVVNCYSTGTTSGSGNGFTSALVTGGSTSNCYWDTTTSGEATSASGTGQTTSALQTPTTPSGIYAAWTQPPWQFGTDTDYPTLTTTP